MLASLMAGPSAPTDSAVATPEGEVELLIPVDATLLATLESGGDVIGDIPHTARRGSQYRLRLVNGASGAASDGSVPPGAESGGSLELLIPVDAMLLARLSAGSEVVGAVPSAARDAARYRLQLTRTSAQVTSFADKSTLAPGGTGPGDADLNGTGDHAYRVTPAAGTYDTTSDLLLPGPERTNTQAPAMMAASPSASSLLAPPSTTSTATGTATGAWVATNPATVEPRRMNEFGPIVSPATDVWTNTLAAAKSILHLPPPPSEAASLRPTYSTTPHVAGLLNLPPPPGAKPPETYAPSRTPGTGAPAFHLAAESYSPLPTENLTPVRRPVAVESVPATSTGLAAPGSKLPPPGTDIIVPSKVQRDLVNAKKDEKPQPRPWAVLSFSLLGLFVSIGGNVLLAWVAWNHRGRYLDLLRKMRREKARA
jgi:hypothetical protein